jgi:hypothetical protein
VRRTVRSTFAALSLAFLIIGCVTYPWTGSHVPIDGIESLEQKVGLAKKVLAALPIDQVREQIRRCYPQLSKKELKRINLSYTKMNFVEKEKPSRQEVHLTVTIDHNRKLHPIADQINNFVASLLREEIKRQRAAAQNPTNGTHDPSPRLSEQLCTGPFCLRKPQWEHPWS